MAKRTQQQKPSPSILEAAEKVAKANQRPGQTKEQTRLIAQGVRKSIEQYKKQQNAKARELDKALKKARLISTPAIENSNSEDSPKMMVVYKQPTLPWILLALSWMGFLGYWYLHR